MTVNLRNPLCERLGIQVPIFGLAHRIEVAAAISRAGGLGVYAAARDGPDELAGKLAALRRLCPDHPVGVDLLLPTGLAEQNTAADVAAAVPEGHRRWVQQLADRHAVPPATRGNFFSMYVRSQALFNEQVAAAVASGVQVFAAGVGTPPGVLARAKAAGQHTIALVGHPKHAHKAIAAGADILVAQGYDAGGHTGPIGTYTLVPQIVAAAGGRPVIAAGGIGGGAQGFRRVHQHGERRVSGGENLTKWSAYCHHQASFVPLALHRICLRINPMLPPIGVHDAPDGVAGAPHQAPMRCERDGGFGGGLLAALSCLLFFV
ncbi:MAG: hypothetical protein CFE45_30215 [Burkholderiales bacterium PBB5]|nr:MAG: hypothetical protein CFE45_30215 [Burkholderiales bacterium PBB5]